jgi:hypothetical protein
MEPTYRFIALVLLLLPVATSIALITCTAQVGNNSELIRVSIGLCNCGDYGALKHRARGGFNTYTLL